MPAYEVTSPDGKKYRVTAPDGATQDEVLAYAQKQFAAPAPKPDMYKQTAKADSNLDNLAAAAGGVLSGIPIGAREIFGTPRPGEFKEWKDSMAGLWSTPMGKVGAIAGGALPAIPAMMIPGVNTVAGAAATGAVMGALEPTGGEDGQRARNVAMGFGLGGLGQKGGQMIGSALSNRAAAKTAEMATAKSQNSVRDATLKAAQEAGFALPPSQVNPTMANRALEGLAGKLTTAQSASAKNQSLANSIVRKDLGLADDAPLMRETLMNLRKDASAKGYAPLKQFGEIAADKPYAQAVLDLGKKYDATTGGMKSLKNPEVEGLLADAQKLSFDSENVVEFLRNMREQGFANAGPLANARDKALGKNQLSIAAAIEDLAERNLVKAGQTEVLQNFRDARKLIAKSFTAEKALNPATGNIDSSKIAAMFSKDKPLSDGMRDLGRIARAFPAATKEVTTSMPGISPLDYYASAGAAAASGNLLPLAMPIARVGMRAGILSGPYQRAMVNAPSYNTSALAKLLGTNKKKTQELLGLLGGAFAPVGDRAE